MNPEDLDFCELVRIVGDVYRLPAFELMGSRKHRFAEARALIGTIWAENHGMEDAARRLMRNSPANVITWQNRIHKILQTNHPSAGRINEVMRRVAKTLPHVVGLYAEDKQ
jgi:hypothetical protein